MITQNIITPNYISDVLDSTILIKCYAFYMDMIGVSDIPVDLLLTETKDINDYKNTAALAYFLLKTENNELKSKFDSSIERISAKPISQTNKLIYDPMAIMGLILAIEKFKLIQFNDWIKNVINEAHIYSAKTQKNIEIIEALREYLNNQNQFTSDSTDYLCLKLWLETKNDNTLFLQEQKQFFEKIWYNKIPYFKDHLLDITAINLVNKCLNAKFDKDFVDSQIILQKLKKRSLSQAKVFSVLISSVVGGAITIGVSYGLKLVWNVNYLPDKPLINNIVFFIITLFGIGGYIIGAYKILPKLHKFLSSFIDKIQNLYRGIN